VVLKRAELNLRLTPVEVDELLDIICLLGVKHEVRYLWRPLLRDPGDEFILELAVAARADAVVTHNVRDFSGAEKFGAGC
jgi:predicted nucleic acid-binding protein